MYVYLITVNDSSTIVQSAIVKIDLKYIEIKSKHQGFTISCKISYFYFLFILLFNVLGSKYNPPERIGNRSKENCAIRQLYERNGSLTAESTENLATYLTKRY